MNSDKLREQISELRDKNLEGHFISLIPYEDKYAEDVVELRDQANCRYYTDSVNYDFTVESQNKWYREYLKKDNDLYYCIIDKKTGAFAGTIRIYKIDFEERSCELGSAALSDTAPKDIPYMTEAYVLVNDLAFDTLGLEYIYFEVKKDNKHVQSLDKRFGAEYLCDSPRPGNGFVILRSTKEKYSARRSQAVRIIDSICRLN